uniref:Uncharacterized protein n=1 Tax=Solanum tuberosum TaxID=4113 RepID=M1DU59_SOLTU
MIHSALRRVASSIAKLAFSQGWTSGTFGELKDNSVIGLGDHQIFPSSTSSGFSLLFTRDDIAQPEPTRALGKRHHSSHVSDTTEDARARKQERQQNNQARRASIVDEESHQQRARESISGA